jgi:DNA polymerase phi
MPGGAPHFVWNEIFDLYFPSKGVAPAKLPVDEPRAKWNDVWRILVDRERNAHRIRVISALTSSLCTESLFAPPSAALKATGFALLTLALQRLPPVEVPALFGDGVVRTFTNNLRKSGENEKTLGRVADKLASALPPFLAANPSVALPLLKALVAPPHGSHSFDHKTTEKLVAKLDLKGAKGWVKYLREFALNAGGVVDSVEDTGLALEADQTKAVNARRMWAFDQLLHVAKTSAVPKDDELIAELLEFFAVLGWFEIRKSGSKGAVRISPPRTTANTCADETLFH